MHLLRTDLKKLTHRILVQVCLSLKLRVPTYMPTCQHTTASYIFELGSHRDIHIFIFYFLGSVRIIIIKIKKLISRVCSLN